MLFCIWAGVTDYVVLVEARRILYIGSKGEMHVETFPEPEPVSDWEPEPSE